MKSQFSAYVTALIFVTILIFISCDKKEVPVLTTLEVTDITGTTAICGGTITDEGSGAIICRGVCWSIDIEPTVEDNKTSDGAGAGDFTSYITNLSGVTTYYVRAYATNNAGTGYGTEMSFTTLGQAPAPIVSAATNIDTTSATLNGSVNANYLSTVVTFEYGPTTSYSQIASAIPSPVTGDTTTNVSTIITGLKAGTTYHFRIVAVNSLGTTYSSDITFVTSGQIPSATTIAATNIATAAAQLNGTVNANYLYTKVTFEFGTTTDYWNSTPASQSPVSGNTSADVTANISGLNSGMTYHFRIRAENSLGTSYGDDMTFITLPKDINNNVYSTITIGTQVWIGQNLKTTMLNNGIPLDFAPDKANWQSLSTPGYCWYDNNTGYKNTFGALYNWYAANSGKLCPTGWHVPTDTEWTLLSDYLGGSTVAGGKLKETGTTHWTSPNTGATNESGFTALPGGIRGNSGDFINISNQGYWWSSTEFNASNAYRQSVDYSSGGFNRLNDSKAYGFSIRCLKD